MNYPKIQTIFKRDEKTGNIKPEHITKREFEVIKDWTITEKIDGMNIHVDFENDSNEHPEKAFSWKVSFHGKTDNAQIPAPLMQHLYEKFGKIEVFTPIIEYFMQYDKSVKKIIIFGEGYGAGIQKGMDYSKDQKFIAYDMWIDGWWLEQLHAKRICDEIGVPFVPVLPITTKEDAIEFVKSNTYSSIAFPNPNPHKTEGVVATSNPLMLFRDGTPIKWKLKQRDYKV